MKRKKKKHCGKVQSYASRKKVAGSATYYFLLIRILHEGYQYVQLLLFPRHPMPLSVLGIIPICHQEHSLSLTSYYLAFVFLLLIRTGCLSLRAKKLEMII